MSKLSRLAVSLLASALFCLPGLATAATNVVTVNGKAIPQNMYDALLAEYKAQGVPDSPQLVTDVKEALIRQEILVQEAKKKGLDKKSDISAQMELAKQGVLMRALLGDFVRAHPVSDDKLKKEYEAIKSKLGDTEYKARHVLLKKEEDAKAVIAKLDKGEKMADLAKQSEDPGSKDNGGDLGWSVPSAAYVPPFAEALMKLKKGEYTKQPIKTDFGFHVILLEDTRALTHPSFDQIKPQLQQRVVGQMVEEYIGNLRAKSTVK